MSAAPALPADAEATAKPKGSRKKLLVIGALVLVVLLAAGAGAMFWLKSKAAHAAEEAGDGAATASVAKPDLAHPPTFLPLEAFVVNLADKDADRLAQVGITLEVENPAVADQLKAFMPAIRNAILLTLAQKTANELLDRAGKEQLAEEIRREAARSMGVDLGAPPHQAAPVKAAPEATSDEGEGDGGAVKAAPATEKPHRSGPRRRRAVPARCVMCTSRAFSIQ